MPTQLSLALMGLTLLSANCLTADDFTFDAPADWRSERIDLPPPFAPNMTLRGVEELRFAPGMFDADSDTFFTYVFVLSIEGEQELTEDMLRRELLAYYQGLAKAVMEVEDKDVEGYSLQLERKQEVSVPPADAEEAVMYIGTISWVEPFATQQPQKLLLEMQTFRLPKTDRNFLFVCASPHPPEHDVWNQMRKIRQTMRVAERAVEAEAPSTN